MLIEPYFPDFEQPVRGRREKEAIRQKCLAAMETGQIVCIDCSLEQHMSEKVCASKVA